MCMLNFSQLQREFLDKTKQHKKSSRNDKTMPKKNTENTII